MYQNTVLEIEHPAGTQTRTINSKDVRTFHDCEILGSLYPVKEGILGRENILSWEESTRGKDAQ